ncbi:tyrosine-type recombinase/integrase [Emticicia sp. ODNR4P]|nr:tyrosine-type recombinase/integrase [Emticicia sp. ODNR4P]
MYSINFRLRSDVKSDQKRVYVRIRKDGVVPPDISTPIVIPVEKWDKNKQSIKGSSTMDSTNRAVLLQIESDITELIRQNNDKTAHQIRNLYVQKSLPEPTILKTYLDFINQEKLIWNDTPKQLKKNTIDRWFNCRVHLMEFLENKDIPLKEIDEDFGIRFYSYLIKKPKKRGSTLLIGNDYAVRVVSYLKEVLTWAKRKKLIEQQVMITDELKRNPPKPLEILSKDQVRAIELCKCIGTMRDVKTIFLAMTYSCLNHCDLHHLETLKNKDHIIITIDRQKNRNRDTAEQSIIPVLPQLRKLLEKIDYKIPKYHINIVNRYCHVFESILHTNLNITTYTARKTGAGLLIDAGVSIEVVSKILGHKSLTTTQRHYVKLSQKNVIDGVKHLM